MQLCVIFLRKGACVRTYVSDMTTMRRTLRANLYKIVGPFDTSPVAPRLAAFATYFCRRSTSDHRAMDLSNMRKKYKGGEDVSCLERLRPYLRWKCKEDSQTSAFLYGGSVITVMCDVPFVLGSLVHSCLKQGLVFLPSFLSDLQRASY